MNRAVQVAEELGCTAIRLDATPLGQPLYESLGFVRQYELTRYAGDGVECLSPYSTRQVVRIGGSDEYAAILALDASATGANRDKFLRRLFTEEPGEVRVTETSGRIDGYLTVRRGSDAIQLGPCIAE